MAVQKLSYWQALRSNGGRNLNIVLIVVFAIRLSLGGGIF